MNSGVVELQWFALHTIHITSVCDRNIYELVVCICMYFPILHLHHSNMKLWGSYEGAVQHVERISVYKFFGFV